MKRYLFNPEYTICNNEGADFVLTPDMTQIFILKEIESVVVHCFMEPKAMDEAIHKISGIFTQASFVPSECEKFIRDLIEANVLILSDDTD